MNNMFLGANLSYENYDSLLNGWSSQTVQNNVEFSAGDAQYSPAGLAGRETLINNYSWIITDGGNYSVETNTITEADSSPTPARGSSTGSGTGSSAGGGSVARGSVTSVLKCSEDWTCGTWSACSIHGLQIRTCTDQNDCNSSINKPTVVQICQQKAYDTNAQSTKKALFDIVLELINQPKSAGDDLIAKISLINFGLSGQVDANLTYTITDQNTQIVKQFTEVVPVKTQTEFLKNINTTGMVDGKYTLNVKLIYAGQSEPASAEKIFYINEGVLHRIFNNTGLDLVIISTIIVALLVYLFIKRQYAAKKSMQSTMKIVIPTAKNIESQIREGNVNDVHEHIMQNRKIIDMYNTEIKSLVEINKTLEQHGFVESAEKVDKDKDEKDSNITKEEHKKTVNPHKKTKLKHINKLQR